MPTQAEVADFQEAVDDVRTLMVAALVEQFAVSTATNPAASIDELRQFVIDIVAEYGLASAGVAVDFYGSVRPAGSPTFSAIPVVRDDLVTGGSLNWATEPLLTEEWSQALDRMAAEIQKAAFEAVIDTIGEATLEDPLDVKYARFPQNDNPCAWCVLRASRGALYWSEESATRGDHIKCQCRITPVFPGEPLPYLRAPYIAQYQAGAAEADGSGRKALLAGMRRANGTR